MVEGDNVWIAFLLVFFGIFVHFLTKLKELENTGRIVTPMQYWRFNPYTSLMVVVGALLIAVFQYTQEELSYTSSLLTGMASNSVGDKLRSMALKRQTDALADLDEG